jgi:DNA polymerase delta subunit 1
VHPDDEAALPTGSFAATPSGARFVAPEVRRGLMPGILEALLAARRAARVALAQEADLAARAVLDARQKALKLMANAAYGFIGAGASPLQCAPIADACLALGAAACRRAREVAEAAAAAGALGPEGRGARVIYAQTDSLFLLLPAAPDAAAAVRAGRAAAAAVSAAFAPPVQLAFERVALPFLLLHVNRYAGKTWAREEDAAAGRGAQLLVKGLKSAWRQSPPIVRTTLHGALERLLMRGDAEAAAAFAEGEVRRLLEGRTSARELALTGGLWRVTGEQIAERAAGEGGNGGDAGGGGAAAGQAPEAKVRGPHAALAVRLAQRDPGRRFVLGERLGYVLLAGHKRQEDAAEDPLTAARAGLPLDRELVWRNKLKRPLEELFAPALPQARLRHLLNGPHTLVRHVDAGPAEGAAAPPPARGLKGGPRQAGMAAFFRPQARCLACRGAVRISGAAADAPALCGACEGAGARPGALLRELGEAGEAAAHGAAAAAACRACDSALLCQPILCANGECPVTYARIEAARRAAAAGAALRRLEM